MNWSNPRFLSWSLCWSAQIKLPLQSSSVSQSRTSHMVHGLLAVHARNETNKVHFVRFSSSCYMHTIMVVMNLVVQRTRNYGSVLCRCRGDEAQNYNKNWRLHLGFRCEVTESLLVFVAKLLKAYLCCTSLKSLLLFENVTKKVSYDFTYHSDSNKYEWIQSCISFFLVDHMEKPLPCLLQDSCRYYEVHVCDILASRVAFVFIHTIQDVVVTARLISCSD